MKQLFILVILTMTAMPLMAQQQENQPDSVAAGQQYQEPDSLDVDTLREIVVNGDTILRVNDAIRQSLKQSGYGKISTKSVSDILGQKTTDKILHPFAYKDRKRERKHARDRKILEEYDEATRVKSFDELLWEAIRQQAIEDGKEPPVKPGKR